MREVIAMMLLILLGSLVAQEMPGAYEAEYQAWVKANNAYILAITQGRWAAAPPQPRLFAR